MVRTGDFQFRGLGTFNCGDWGLLIVETGDFNCGDRGFLIVGTGDF